MIPPEKVGSESDGTDGDNVFCNVYDILPRVNALARCLGSQWGIYHTGVQVHGLEVSFGGTDDNCTGVFCAQPRSAQGARFRRQVPIGRVDLDPFELRQRVADISEAWPGRAYDPFERNCNHFSDCFCSELTGQGAPPYVNRFTKSRVIRCVFFRCLVPLGRCVERFHKVEPITYAQDASCGAEVAELYGVRGINQVLVEAATVQKARANDLFRSGAFVEARDAYEKALGYLTRLQTQNLVRGQSAELRAAVLLNIAAIDLRDKNFEQVVQGCNLALRDDPKSIKALYRRGVALSSLGQLQEASRDFNEVLQLSQDSSTTRDVRIELAKIKRLRQAEKDEHIKFAKRMLGAL